MRKLLVHLFCLVFWFTAAAQPLQRPKLVVGIVVDQMRWDYLYRFYDRYSEGGFKRLLGEGFSCENMFIPYTPTYTAAGHTCVYTGSVPALHGIMGNSWYDRAQKKIIYCTDDSAANAVGSNSVAGKMSPRNLWANTLGDEMRLATNFRSKTISIALKDRASILPGGHASNGSFWFDNATGSWISSTFYMNELPRWMQQFNARKLPDGYLKDNWTTLYPVASYVQSAPDSNAFEGRLPGEDMTFPHNTASITNNKYETFRTMPMSNTYTFETAKAAIEGEQLGGRNVTDLLALSFSAPDLIGHAFGPYSVEVEDTYLRFDRDLAGFINYLDGKLGKGQYLLFLTADHGASLNPAFLKANKLPIGTFNINSLRRQMNDSLRKYFNVPDLIEQTINYQVYLDDNLVRANNLDKSQVRRYLIEWIMKQPGVANVVDLASIENATLQPRMKMMLVNGYNQKLSGDLQIIIKPQFFETLQTGTTHGQWNPYDAHIPLLWYGWHVQPGQLNREVYMTDIAPTVAAMLHVQMPNACVGKVIEEVSKK